MNNLHGDMLMKEKQLLLINFVIIGLCLKTISVQHSMLFKCLVLY